MKNSEKPSWNNKSSYLHNNNNGNNFNPASDLRRLLRQSSQSFESPTEDLPEINDNEINGPYNFRQLLRPTEHAPTESLRKRKGVVPGEVKPPVSHSCSAVSNVDDSPNKRRAKPIPKYY